METVKGEIRGEGGDEDVRKILLFLVCCMGGVSGRCILGQCPPTLRSLRVCIGARRAAALEASMFSYELAKAFQSCCS